MFRPDTGDNTLMEHLKPVLGATNRLLFFMLLVNPFLTEYGSVSVRAHAE